jgi:hypothetical protein
LTSSKATTSCLCCCINSWTPCKAFFFFKIRKSKGQMRKLILWSKNGGQKCWDGFDDWRPTNGKNTEVLVVPFYCPWPIRNPSTFYNPFLSHRSCTPRILVEWKLASTCQFRIWKLNLKKILNVRTANWNMVNYRLSSSWQSMPFLLVSKFKYWP